MLRLLTLQGVRVFKVGRQGPARTTELRLSADGAFLQWRSRHKDAEVARVPLAAVQRFTVNKQASRNFARLNQSAVFRRANKDPLAVVRSVSLSYNAGKAALDFVVLPSPQLNDTVRARAAGRRGRQGGVLA